MPDLKTCYGVSLVCRMQLAADPKAHECKQAGKCMFAPASQDEPKVHCHACPAEPENHCTHNCLEVMASLAATPVVPK